MDRLQVSTELSAVFGREMSQQTRCGFSSTVQTTKLSDPGK